MLWAWNVVFVCNTESIFLCVSTSEAEPPPATHYHFNHCLYPLYPPSQRWGLCQNFKQTTLTTRLYKVRKICTPYLRKRSDAPSQTQPLTCYSDDRSDRTRFRHLLTSARDTATRLLPASGSRSDLNSAEADEGGIDSAHDDDGGVVGVGVGVAHDVAEQSHRLHQLIAEHNDQYAECQLNEVHHHQQLADADTRTQRQIHRKWWRRHRHL